MKFFVFVVAGFLPTLLLMEHVKMLQYCLNACVCEFVSLTDSYVCSMWMGDVKYSHIPIYTNIRMHDGIRAALQHDQPGKKELKIMCIFYYAYIRDQGPSTLPHFKCFVYDVRV